MNRNDWTFYRKPNQIISFISTRNPGLEHKWSTLDQKWSNLDQIWFTLDQNYFLRLLLRFFAQNYILVKALKNYFTNINSLMHFQVGPEVVQGDFWSRVEHFWSNPGFLVLFIIKC